MQIRANHLILKTAGGLALIASLGCPLPAAAQSAGYQPPLTAFGAPDLQGTWTNNTITPLTRPAEFQNLVLSRDQAQAWERRIADYTVQQDQPSDPDRPPPSKDAIELADSYNNFWFDDGTRVAVYDGEYRSSLLIDPPDGQLPEYTGSALARIERAREQRNLRGAFDGPEARPLPERCMLSFGSSSGPPMLPILYNNHYQIVQSPGYVMILVEMVHDVRIIRIGEQSLPGVMTPWMGDSTGRWEGATLVVETTRINPSQRFRNSSDTMQVTERFTRVAEDKINYSFTVHDPDTFVSDFSGEIPMQLTTDRLYEYACHEGNYSLPGVLAGARKDEVEQEFK
ncbi:MAG: hypothetical protein R3F50_20675 [Gammaproteobacteria bacterium]